MAEKSLAEADHKIASVAMTRSLIPVNLWRPLWAKRIFLLISNRQEA
jgi:hypothetical protein